MMSVATQQDKSEQHLMGKGTVTLHHTLSVAHAIQPANGACSGNMLKLHAVRVMPNMAAARTRAWFDFTRFCLQGYQLNNRNQVEVVR